MNLFYFFGGSLLLKIRSFVISGKGILVFFYTGYLHVKRGTVKLGFRVPFGQNVFKLVQPLDIEGIPSAVEILNLN